MLARSITLVAHATEASARASGRSARSIDRPARARRVVGCWAGCHGRVGEGRSEKIKGIQRSAAPTLSQVVLPQYSDEELARLIRYGVKRDGSSTIEMISYATWALGDQDLVDIIAHLSTSPSRKSPSCTCS